MQPGDRTMVGANAYAIPEEEEIHPSAYPISAEEILRKAVKLKELKKNRDPDKLGRVMKEPLKVFKYKEQNHFPVLVDAMKAYTRHGETFGLFRTACGLSYDLLWILPCPFAL